MTKGDVPAKGKHAPGPAIGAGARGPGGRDQEREPAGAPAPIDDSRLRDYLADALTPEDSARVEKALRDSAELRARLEDVRHDAEVLDCLDEVEHCRSIVGSGTSADRQLAVFEKAQGSSDDRTHALRAVTDWLAEATLQ